MSRFLNWFGLSASASERRPQDPTDEYWWSAAGPAYMSYINSNPDAARTLPVVDNCVSYLSQTLAALPGMVFERMPNGTRREVPDHPLIDVLKVAPNPDQTAFEFIGDMQDACGLFGNALAEIRPGERGAVNELRRIYREQWVRCERDRSGVIWYVLRNDMSGERRLRQDEVFHVKALPLQSRGLVGTSPVSRVRRAVAAALALHDYGYRFFENDTQSGGIITATEKWADDESRAAFLKAWRDASSRSGRHRDRILDFGMDYKEVRPNNEQAQFLDTRKELNLELCRGWNMPPHKVGILDNATFSNIEHQGLEFVTDTFLPWVVSYEQRINLDLIADRRRYYWEFNLDALLRADLKTRYSAYFQGRQGGWLSANDIRRKENMNPIPGGDEYLQPLNMAPMGGGKADPAGGDSPSSALLGNVVADDGDAETVEVVDHAQET